MVETSDQARTLIERAVFTLFFSRYTIFIGL